MLEKKKERQRYLARRISRPFCPFTATITASTVPTPSHPRENRPIRALSTHLTEDATSCVQEDSRGVELHNPALVEDQDPIIVHDGLEPVRDGDDYSACELFPDCLLDLYR